MVAQGSVETQTVSTTLRLPSILLSRWACAVLQMYGVLRVHLAT